ncbi:hypothetical protein [Paraburkholderia gardini]|uniref:Uncharacterized protein n=1 Tax=Paraburkholderia gardini TaxID=2823469 RepID=A0ABN7QPM5_9BURK|nr:hypothetical protein [Paraburkholderia gardini]CAG4890376.1 hypothetical protein R69919_00919 [Paraburkholderia gardini]CAG4916823.1 hypothetical protein R54767_04342 [Paraburkholderia gardini]
MESTTKVHYETSVCGGDFKNVLECFKRWKREPLVFRPGQNMFEGKEEVRRVSERVFGNGELAQNTLMEMCDPCAPYALAAEIRDDERDMWLVMAAYAD